MKQYFVSTKGIRTVEKVVLVKNKDPIFSGLHTLLGIPSTAPMQIEKIILS
jgi:hypothetical protein